MAGGITQAFPVDSCFFNVTSLAYSGRKSSSCPSGFPDF
jgi:hypothetical protein